MFPLSASPPELSRNKVSAHAKSNVCGKLAFLNILLFVCISDAVATEKPRFEAHLRTHILISLLSY